LIDVYTHVRGRALYYHPNRLAEFVEQLGLLLAACAVCGPLRVLAAIGALAALAGSWASGSTAGMAAMGGGGVLTVAAIVAWRLLAARREVRGEGEPRPVARSGRVAIATGLLAVAGAIAGVAAVLAYQFHGGLGPRALVYREAWRVIARVPILGVGGGNWSFEVASRDPMRRFWFSSHTHSLVLQIWVELGIVGLAIASATFAVPIALGLRAFARAAPAWRGVAAGACAGVLGLLAHDLVHYFLRDPADGLLTGILLGLAAAAPYRAQAERA
jgi:O-antigen ligase